VFLLDAREGCTDYEDNPSADLSFDDDDDGSHKRLQHQSAATTAVHHP